MSASDLGRLAQAFLDRVAEAEASAVPAEYLQIIRDLVARLAPLLAGVGRDVPLSPREREIVGYLALGLGNRDIATALGTSPNTVRNQMVRLFEKLGVENRTQLAALVARASHVPSGGEE